MLLLSFLNALDVKSCLGLLLVSLLIFDFWKSKNAPNFPPGPWGFPFLGNVFMDFDCRAMDQASFSLISFTHIKEELIKTLSQALLADIILVMYVNVSTDWRNLTVGTETIKLLPDTVYLTRSEHSQF